MSTDISSITSLPSGTTGAGGGNMLRITGMSTGLDVDAMVKKMLASDQSKIYKIQQQQQTIQWKQQAYQKIITDIRSLQSMYFDITDSDNYLLTQNNYNNLAASPAGGSVTAIAKPGAAIGNYSIKVDNTAAAASISGGKSLNTQFKIGSSGVAGWGGAGRSIAFDIGAADTAIDLSGFAAGSDGAGLAAYLNKQISSNTTLNGKVSASYVSDASGDYIKFTPLTSDAMEITGSSISDVNSNMFKVTGTSNWSGKSITINVNGADVSPIDLSGYTITDGNSIAAAVNDQISKNVDLKDKVSATCVQDPSGSSYIEFNSLTADKIQIASSTSVTDITVTGVNLAMPGNITSVSLAAPLTSLTGDSSLKTNLTLNLKYNGTFVSVNLDNSKGTATIGDLAAAISTKTGTQVMGSLDDMTGKFTLQTANTGAASSLSLISDNVSNKLLGALGLSAASSTGTDAKVEITSPGSSSATTLTETSNNFTVNGMTYNISGAGADSTTSISVTSDTTKVHDMIKSFVDKYNSIADEIQTQLTTKPDAKYPPLTDAQKSAMSSTDITNWNNKAQEGILFNDSKLQSLLTSLRSAYTTPLTDSSGNSITSLRFGNHGAGAIGIDTFTGYSQGDKISIVDDSKLTNAIANNEDQFIKLFTNTSTSPDKTKKFNESGIFQRINTILQDNIGTVGTTLNNGTLSKYANIKDDYSISGGAGGTGTIPDQIYAKQVIIDNLTKLMSADQTKYYKQFSQLETAMTELNAQQTMVSSLFQ